MQLTIIKGEHKTRPDDWGYLNPNHVSREDWLEFSAACKSFYGTPVLYGDSTRLTLAVCDLIDISTEVVNIPSLRVVR